MIKRILIAMTALMLILALSGMAGCASPQKSADHSNCVVIYAQRMNSSASPDLAKDEMLKTIESHGYLDVVRLDGKPSSSANCGAVMGSNDANEKNREYEEQMQLRNAMSLLEGTSAASAEVDIAAAFDFANRSLSAADTCKGVNTVVICDSGLSTSGIIDFTQEGMLCADPDSFVSFLKERSILPDYSHIDRVVWCGFGDVCGDQEKVPLSVSENLKALYRTYLEAAGVGDVVFLDNVSSPVGSENTKLPNVTLVPMPESQSFQGAGSIVKLDQTQLSFKGDSDEFINEEAARKVLKEYASALAKDPSLMAIVEGYTASYPSDSTWPTRLSEMRASKVRTVLCEQGAKESQIDAAGRGVGPVADLDANGLQIESLAAQNRYVLITFK